MRDPSPNEIALDEKALTALLALPFWSYPAGGDSNSWVRAGTEADAHVDSCWSMRCVGLGCDDAETGRTIPNPASQEIRSTERTTSRARQLGLGEWGKEGAKRLSSDGPRFPQTPRGKAFSHRPWCPSSGMIGPRDDGVSSLRSKVYAGPG